MAAVRPGTDPGAETEDQAALRQLAREVAAREVAPRAAAHDESGEVPREAIAAMAAADLFRVTIGEQWGGLGMGDVEAAIVLEEIARHDVSTAICCQLAYNGPARGIEHLGSDALKDRWLPAVADGEAIISIGITEPDAGSAVQEHAHRPQAGRTGRVAPRRLQELLHAGPRRLGRAGLVPVARGRGRPGDRRGHRSHGPRGGVPGRASPGHGHPRRHRVGDRLRRCGHHRGRRPGGRGPVLGRAVQAAPVPPQPRTVRERRHVRRCRPGRPGAVRRPTCGTG